MKDVASRFPDDPDAATFTRPTAGSDAEYWREDYVPQPGTQEVIDTERTIARFRITPRAPFLQQSVEVSERQSARRSADKPEPLMRAGHLVHARVTARGATRTPPVDIRAIKADENYITQCRRRRLPAVYYPLSVLVCIDVGEAR
jgi:hypothetical protein